MARELQAILVELLGDPQNLGPAILAQLLQGLCFPVDVEPERVDVDAFLSPLANDFIVRQRGVSVLLFLVILRVLTDKRTPVNLADLDLKKGGSVRAGIHLGHGVIRCG